MHISGKRPLPSKNIALSYMIYKCGINIISPITTYNIFYIIEIHFYIRKHLRQVVTVHVCPNAAHHIMYWASKTLDFTDYHVKGQMFRNYLKLALWIPIRTSTVLIKTPKLDIFIQFSPHVKVSVTTQMIPTSGTM